MYKTTKIVILSVCLASPVAKRYSASSVVFTVYTSLVCLWDIIS